MWEGDAKILGGCTAYPKDNYGLIVEILDRGTVSKTYRVKLEDEGYWKYTSINFSHKPSNNISVVLKCEVQSLTIEDFSIREVDNPGGITIGAK